MSTKTKKVGPTGRFGARYGRGIKERIRKIEVKMKAKHKCPKCEKQAVKRKGYALWECSKCNTQFAGGAYMPTTDFGRLASRAIQFGSKGISVAKDLVEEMEEEKEVKEEK